MKPHPYKHPGIRAAPETAFKVRSFLKRTISKHTEENYVQPRAHKEQKLLVLEDETVTRKQHTHNCSENLSRWLPRHPETFYRSSLCCVCHRSESQL